MLKVKTFFGPDSVSKLYFAAFFSYILRFLLDQIIQRPLKKYIILSWIEFLVLQTCLHEGNHLLHVTSEWWTVCVYLKTILGFCAPWCRLLFIYIYRYSWEAVLDRTTNNDDSDLVWAETRASSYILTKELIYPIYSTKHRMKCYCFLVKVAFLVLQHLHRPFNE